MKSYLRKFEIYRNLAFAKRFLLANHYIPNVSSPITYNEKILHRKKYSHASKFSQYADKIIVKDHVKELVSSDIVIPTLYTGSSINTDLVNELFKDYNGLVLKANHNSGPVYVIDDNICQDKLTLIVEDLNRQLKIDYGVVKGERWYSDIVPKILVEKKIEPEVGEKDLKDYKFHVFKQEDGSSKVILHVDFDRNGNHHRSYFDEDLNWLPFYIEYPTFITNFPKPKNYSKMIEIAKKLAEPFSYVRVDLYNVDGHIYFGELTFAPGSGLSSVSDKKYDEWLGGLWEKDPRI